MGDYGHYIICTLFSCCSIQEKVTKWHFIPTCIPVVPWQAFKWSMMASLTSHSFIICDDSSSISDYVAVKTINSCFILFVFPPLRSWIHAVSYGGGCRLGRESGHSRRHFRVNLCLAITMTTSRSKPPPVLVRASWIGAEPRSLLCNVPAQITSSNSWPWYRTAKEKEKKKKIN